MLSSIYAGALLTFHLYCISHFLLRCQPDSPPPRCPTKPSPSIATSFPNAPRPPQPAPPPPPSSRPPSTHLTLSDLSPDSFWTAHPLTPSQTALISHQPDLAIQIYIRAAIPPISSPKACLALAHLVVRGAGVSTPTPHLPVALLDSVGSYALPPPIQGKGKGKGKAPAPALQISTDSSEISPSQSPLSSISTFFASFFTPTTPTPAPDAPSPTPAPKPRTNIAANGWSIPLSGKRAVRDVPTMGEAAGWCILGLAMCVEAQVRADAAAVKGHRRSPPLEMASRGSRRRLERVGSGSASGSGGTEESSLVRTPYEEWRDEEGGAEGDAERRLRLLVSWCAALCPIFACVWSMALGPRTSTWLFLARRPNLPPHSCIANAVQPLTPVGPPPTPPPTLPRRPNPTTRSPSPLPSISPADLPALLQPQGDLEKGRNAWQLGGVVARRVVELGAVGVAGPAGVEWVRQGVFVMASYIVSLALSALLGLLHAHPDRGCGVPRPDVARVASSNTCPLQRAWSRVQLGLAVTLTTRSP